MWLWTFSEKQTKLFEMEEYAREPCPYRIVDDCGGAFAMGCIGGGVFQAIKGFRNAPSGLSRRFVSKIYWLWCNRSHEQWTSDLNKTTLSARQSYINQSSFSNNCRKLRSLGRNVQHNRLHFGSLQTERRSLELNRQWGCNRRNFGST